MRIICIHQSADLYGSDRSFLQVVHYLVISKQFDEITIILPRMGPLVVELRKMNVNIVFQKLSLLSKTYLKKLQIGKIIFPLFSLLKKRSLYIKYDIIYVNTSVILDFYLLAPIIRKKKIIHIREIPNKRLAKVLSFFLKVSKALVIFNSEATMASFGKMNRSIVIHNSFEGYKNFIITENHHDGKQLNILLIGRINSWKGQDFAIDALSKIKETNFVLRILGNTSTGNENLIVDLKNKVNKLGLNGKVEFFDFVQDPEEFYQWSDVVIVPSIKPEPFGRIAIEAMSLGKPVIGSNHGGLKEIILDNKTGYLFEPNNIAEFNRALGNYLIDREILAKHGKYAKAVFEEKFSVESMYSQLDGVFKV